MIGLVIISDIRLYREGLAEILEHREQFNVQGTAADVASAIQIISAILPDIVLLDMAMIDSCKVVNDISAKFPQMRIVVLALTDDEDAILTCAKAGISGYVSRDAPLDHLVNAIRNVANGELFCPRQVVAGLLNKLKSTSYASENMPDVFVQNTERNTSCLTERERQVAELISGGMSNKQIARNLTIEVSTVKNHVHSILTKMGVQNRLQAVTILKNRNLHD